MEMGPLLMVTETSEHIRNVAGKTVIYISSLSASWNTLPDTFTEMLGAFDIMVVVAVTLLQVASHFEPLYKFKPWCMCQRMEEGVTWILNSSVNCIIYFYISAVSVSISHSITNSTSHNQGLFVKRTPKILGISPSTVPLYIPQPLCHLVSLSSASFNDPYTTSWWLFFFFLPVKNGQSHRCSSPTHLNCLVSQHLPIILDENSMPSTFWSRLWDEDIISGLLICQRKQFIHVITLTMHLVFLLHWMSRVAHTLVGGGGQCNPRARIHFSTHRINMLVQTQDACSARCLVSDIEV